MNGVTDFSKCVAFYSCFYSNLNVGLRNDGSKGWLMVPYKKTGRVSQISMHDWLLGSAFHVL